jgi:putative glutamine amidotransferase
MEIFAGIESWGPTLWSNEIRYLEPATGFPRSLPLPAMSARRPVIGIPADRRTLGAHPFHAVGEKYITPLLRFSGALPLLIPSLGEELGQAELVEELDGLLFTGSPSNVEPHHYGGEQSRAGTLHDPARDATTLRLIPRAIAAGVPVLGICRGFQEMNVAGGGTLWQHVHEVPGKNVHHEDENAPLDVQYGPAHEVTLAQGGLLAGIAGRGRITVNSLHHQGVRDLGAGLIEEARADDGLIEAFRVAGARRFALAVQWHPEWNAGQDSFSTALFQAFGDAARERAASK